MRIIPEAAMAGLVTAEDAYAAVAAVFADMARGGAENFPVVRQALGEGRQYGFKSGRMALALGVKAGGYFPGNAARGMTNHQSSVVLFDPDSGRPLAMIGGNLLTALRTAAAAALSVDRLARPEVRVLGILGAGHQAAYQLRAVARVRDFTKVLAWNRHPERLAGLAAVAADLGLAFEAVERERMVEAEVIVTITSSPVFSLAASQVAPGTHLACMGSDTVGKQEVEPQLLVRARVFTDVVAQAVQLGEAQHAVAAGLIAVADLATLGDVLVGATPGRQSADEITLFDGTGVAVQDLAVAGVALRRAQERGIGMDVDL